QGEQRIRLPQDRLQELPGSIIDHGTASISKDAGWPELIATRPGCCHAPSTDRNTIPVTGNFEEPDLRPRMANGLSMDRLAQRVASVTSVRPERRRAQIARLRRAAMTL